MGMSDEQLTKAEARTRISRLKKMVKDHERWCLCDKCTELANAEIDFAFEYEEYGEYLK
jgi:hypothetical protein